MPELKYRTMQSRYFLHRNFSLPLGLTIINLMNGNNRRFSKLLNGNPSEAGCNITKLFSIAALTLSSSDYMTQVNALIERIELTLV